MITATDAQLSAAFTLWEQARHDDLLISQAEADQLPVAEHVEGLVVAFKDYLQQAQGAGA